MNADASLFGTTVPSSGRLVRVLVLGLLLLTVSAFAAPAAWAAEVRARSDLMDDGWDWFEVRWVEYTAGEGEANELEVELSSTATHYRLTEQGPGVTLSDGDGAGGCEVSDNVALCPVDQDHIRAHLGSRDDRMTNATSEESAVDGDGGDDELWGGARGDSLDGGDGSDRLYGRDGPDTLKDGPGAGLLDGGDGDDRLAGGTGADSFTGGPGRDGVSYEDRTLSSLVVSLDGLANDGDASDATGDQRDNVDPAIEGLRGGSNGDRLQGNAGEQYLSGGGGDDVLVGGGGADTLDGWTGADSLHGGSGADRFIGGPNPDTFYGGADLDTVSYEDRTNPVAVRLDGQRNDGRDRNGDLRGDEEDRDIGIENAVGGFGFDLLVGNRGTNRLFGSGGRDLLDGRDGTGARDVLDCGPNTRDGVRRDPSDRSPNCERAF